MQVLRTSVFIKPRRFVRNRSKLVLKTGSWRSGPDAVKRKLLTSPRRTISYILIAFGGALCAYVLGAYGWMYIHQEMLLRQWRGDNPAVRQNLTKLVIPKIHLEDVVLEDASQHSLLLGPAHLAGSAEPGTVGNAVIAGHRDTFFRHIHSLRYGDHIFVLRGGRQFQYVVRERKIVDSHDLSVLNASPDSRLTLITCYPTHAIGPAPRRLIIVAKSWSGT